MLLQLAPKDESVNQYWLALFLSNSVQPIAAVSVDGIPLKLSTWGFWEAESGVGESASGSHTITLTSRNGDVLTTSVQGDDWAAQELNVQFAPSALGRPMTTEHPPRPLESL